MEPMSDETTIEAPKATLFIERSVQVRPYETVKAAMHFPVDLPLASLASEDPESYYRELDARLRSGFTTIKCHLFEQLGLEYEDRNGVIFEKIAAQFQGAAEVVSTAAVPPQPSNVVPISNGQGHPVFGTCKKCGGTSFYDNREKKASGQYKSNAADGKCMDKACAAGVWLKK